MNEKKKVCDDINECSGTSFNETLIYMMSFQQVLVIEMQSVPILKAHSYANVNKILLVMDSSVNQL